MANDEPAKPKRRLIRKSETVRDKVEKTTTNADKPSGRRLKDRTRKAAKPLRAVAKPFRFIGRFVIPPYFRNSWRELRQVTWPSRRETWQLTFAVIAFATVFGVVIAGVDFGLDKLFKQVLIK